MKVAVIGGGFSGMSAAAYAAAAGNEVHLFEKHEQAGGRARQLVTERGYVFDMGPSWYWMADIIENFFKDFSCKTSDFFELVALDPQFEIIFRDGTLAVPASYEGMLLLFEKEERGAGKKLDQFMKAARFKYEVAMQNFVSKPCHSWAEFMSCSVARNVLKLDLLSNFRRYVARYFKNPKLRTLMEFPVIFLGASPKRIPALYSLMNYGGYVLGTQYPRGGFYALVAAMQKVAEAQGVMFHFNHTVEKINTEANSVTSLTINGRQYDFDAIIASSDYHFTETLLDDHLKNYKEHYWQSRTFAPSCLLYYLGFKEKISRLKHHTLFFEPRLDDHLDDIYTHRRWPEDPLFYVCCPSRTDASVAPAGCENIFLLMPLSPGIEDGEERREQYLATMLKRIELHTGTGNLASKLEYKKSYCVTDFINDYNACSGNAYGLANTLFQTAAWKPKIRNRNIKNLLYTGQLTVPGPGVPPAIISGKIVAGQISKLRNNRPGSQAVR